MKVIGKPRRRVDGRAKVTGQTRFADDIVLPRMLHMRLLRSPHPHALIQSIDVERAKKHPGVHLVLTGKDFPVSFGILPVTQDEYPLAPEHVRYVGDPVAAVVAKDEQTASEALDLISVQYKPLKTISDPLEALQNAEPRIHARESSVEMPLSATSTASRPSNSATRKKPSRNPTTCSRTSSSTRATPTSRSSSTPRSRRSTAKES